MCEDGHGGHGKDNMNWLNLNLIHFIITITGAIPEDFVDAINGHRKHFSKKKTSCPPSLKLCQDIKRKKLEREKLAAQAAEEAKAKFEEDFKRREELARWTKNKERELLQQRREEAREAAEEAAFDEEIDKGVAALEEAERLKLQLKQIIKAKKEKNARRMQKRRARISLTPEARNTPVAENPTSGEMLGFEAE